MKKTNSFEITSAVVVAILSLLILWQVNDRGRLKSDVHVEPESLVGAETEREIAPDEVVTEEAAVAVVDSAELPRINVGAALGLKMDSGDKSWVAEFAAMRGPLSVQEEVPQAVPEGLARFEVNAPDVNLAIHSFRPVPGIDPAEAGAYRAFYSWHPRQGMQLGLDPLGLSIAADGQRWFLRADSLEVNGADEPLPLLAGRVDVSSDAAYLESGRLKQFIANEAATVEHWMKLGGTGTVSGLVKLRFDQVGDLTMALEADAKGLLLSSDADDVADAVIRYHGLKAWDADGKELEARFELEGGRMVIALQTENARYPLIIDPLIERVKGAELGDLALTLASDIDIVAVGAPEFDYDTGTFDRFQAIMQAVEREYVKTTLGIVQSMFPTPNPINMGKAFAIGVVSGFFSGSDYVNQAEEIAVLDNIGMVWVFSRGLNGWVLAATLDNIVESQTQARKSLDERGVSYDEWRLGEGLAVADGQLLVGEPGRAYWELADIPNAVTLLGQLIPGVGTALTWADGRPLHTKPRRKGAVYVFNHPQYEGPVQYIDGVFDGGYMYGEVGAKIVVEDNQAVIFSGESIEARAGTIVSQDDTETPSPKTSSWVAHHFERSGSEWTRGTSWHAYRKPTISDFTSQANYDSYIDSMPLLKAAALDRHGDLWTGSLFGDGTLKIGRLNAGSAIGSPLAVVATDTGTRVSFDHWSGGGLSQRSHLAVGLPDFASGAGCVRLVDTSSADRSQRPLLIEQIGEAGQGLGRSVAATDMALMACDDAGAVQAWRADAEGWRGMTGEESGAINNLESVTQLAAGRFWTVAMTESSATEKGMEILSAEIPRTVSGRLTFNGKPVSDMPIDAMEFIVLRGEGMEIEPFVYECGVNCDQRGADEPLTFDYQTGRFVELANYDLSGYWGPAKSGRMIPIMGVEIEGAPDLRSLSFLGAGYWAEFGTRDWNLYGRVRPLTLSDAGGYRGADYGYVAEDFYGGVDDLRDPISASGWDELRLGALGQKSPLIPNQDRLRLLMHDPYSADPGRFTSQTGVGTDFVARLAMGKDAPTRVMTDDDGRFTIIGLRPSTAGLRISRSPEDGSAPVRSGIYRLTEGGEDINLYENIAVSGIELKLDGGNYGFSGRVSAAGDKVTKSYRFSSEESPNNSALALTLDRAPGLAGMTVRAVNVSGFDLEVTATTDADGVYVFENLLPGDYSVEVLGLGSNWQFASAGTVAASYRGRTGHYEFAYRQRGLPGGQVVSGYQIPEGSGSVFVDEGFVFGSESEVRQGIADSLPYKKDGQVIAYEYSRIDSPFKYPFRGWAELQRLRECHVGADLVLSGTATIEGSAPWEGTRIRWTNDLGQSGIVSVKGGLFELREMAPGNYTFEVLDGVGYSDNILTRTVTGGSDTPSADFAFANAGSVRLSGIDARTLAGQAPVEAVDFRRQVRLISTDGDRSATHSSAVNVTAAASGSDLLTLAMNGLDAAELRFDYSLSQRSGYGQAILTVSDGSGCASVLEWVDPFGRSYPFVLPASDSIAAREVLLDYLPPVNGTWTLRSIEVRAPLSIESAKLRFPNSTTQFAFALDSDGDGRAPSVPGGEYWLEIPPRLGGSQPLAFIVERTIDVARGQSTNVMVRGEPLAQISVRALDTVDALVLASDLQGRVFFDSSETPGLFWELSPESSGTQYRGLAPWWSASNGMDGEGRLHLVQNDFDWDFLANSGQSLRRNSPEGIPIRVEENVIYGQILDRGNPAVGIVVRLGTGETATTNAQGDFAIQQPPVGDNTISVELSGVMARSFEHTQGRTELVFSRATSQIQGRVIRSGGNIVPGATVTLTGNGESAETLTDASGRFVFQLPPGDYQIHYTKRFYESSEGIVFTHGSEASGLGDLTLKRELGEVAGRVTRDGVGLANVSVLLKGLFYWENGGGEPRDHIDLTAKTDGNGDYRFEGIPAGYFRISPSLPGFAFSPGIKDHTTFTESFWTEESILENSDMDFEAFSAGISGYIKVRGRAVGGVRVRVADAAGAKVAEGVSDASGFYELQGLPPGGYTLSVIPEAVNGVLVANEGPRALEISGNTSIELADVELKVVRFSGQLVDELGDAVAGGRLTLIGPESLLVDTDDEGRWSVELIAGSYDVSIDAAGVDFSARSRLLHNDTDSIVFDGFRGGEMRGRVMLEGAPVPGLSIYLGERFTKFPLAVSETDEDGYYHFTKLRRQAHVVRVAFPDGRQKNILSEEIERTGDVTTTRNPVLMSPIELSNPASVSGLVSWQGTPMSGVDVFIEGGASVYGASQVIAARTGADGSFVLHALAGADYVVRTNPASDINVGTFSGFGLENRDGLELELRATKEYTIYQYLGHGSEVSPVPYGSVIVNGRAIDPSVSQGRVNYTFSVPSGLPIALEVILPDGYANSAGESRFTRTINPFSDPDEWFWELGGTGSVSGRVVSAAGQPLASWVVQRVDAEGSVLSTVRTDAQGRYEFSELVPDQEYRFVVAQRTGLPSGESFYFPDYQRSGRMTVDEASSDTPFQLAPLVAYPDPEGYWLPVDASYVGTGVGELRLTVPGEWVSNDQSYVCSFWMKSRVPWFGLAGNRLAILASDDQSGIWELKDAVFTGASGEGVRPTDLDTFGPSRWQHIGLQFDPSVDGTRRVVVRRFGYPVETIHLPAAADVDAADIVVQVASGDEFGGLSILPGELSPDEWLDLAYVDAAPVVGARLSFAAGQGRAVLDASDGCALVSAFSDSLTERLVARRAHQLVEGESGDVEMIWLDYFGVDGTAVLPVDSAGRELGLNRIAFHSGFSDPAMTPAEVTLEVLPMVTGLETIGSVWDPGNLWYSGENRLVRILLNGGHTQQRTLSVSSEVEGVASQIVTIEPGQSSADIEIVSTALANDAIGRLYVSREISNGESREYASLSVSLKQGVYGVTGQIINNINDEGIAGLAVQLVGVGETMTDVEGRFVFAEVPRGTYILSTRNDGWSFAGNNNRQITVAEEPLVVGPIVATGQYLIAGTLREAGYPALSGVTVYLSGPGLSRASAVTDSAGLYAFSQLGGGDYELYVDDKRFLPRHQGKSFELTDWSQMEDISIKQGVFNFGIGLQNPAPGLSRSIVAARTYTVRPTAFSYSDSSGTWSADYETYAQIRERTDSATQRLAIAKTDSERYRLRSLVGNLPEEFQPHAYALDSYGLDAEFGLAEPSFWGDGTPVDFDVIEELAAPEEASVLALRGDTGFTLLAPDSRSYAGFVQEKINAFASVTLTSVPDDDLILYLKSSHPELLTVPLSITVPGLSSGGTETNVKIPLFTNPVEEPVTVNVTLLYGLDRFAGQKQSTVTLVPARTIEGRVTDVTGMGLADFAVSDGVYRWLTDGNGVYRVEATDPSQGLRVQPVFDDSVTSAEPAAYPFGANLQRSFEGNDFVIKGDHAISGSINGLYAPDLERVAIEGLGIDTDAFGAFSLGEMLPGTYLLRPVLAGYRFEPAQVEVVLPRDSDTEIAFTALRGFEFAGMVTSGGNPLPGASVQLRDGSGLVLAWALTAENGRFEISSEFSPGSDVRFVVTASGHTPRSIDFVPGELDAWTLSLEPNRISGLLIRADGDPLSGATVTTAGITATSDENGLYVMEGIPEGTLDFVIRQGGRSFEVIREVPAGGGSFNGFDLHLESKVSGYLTDGTGDPIVGATIALTGSDAPEPAALGFPIDLTFDPAGLYDYEEKFFEIAREGAVQDMSLKLLLSGNGADWVAIRLIPPSGIQDLVDLVKGDNASGFSFDSDGKVRLEFDSRSGSPDSAAFKQWFDSTIKGEDVSGFWSVHVYMARTRNPFTGQYGGYRDYASLTLESLQINPITPGEPTAETTSTDADGYYQFEPLPGSYSLSASGVSGSEGFAPPEAAVDTAIGPERVDFVRSAHPAVQWTVPVFFNLDTDPITLLQTASASVPGTFVYRPATLAALSPGEVDLELVFTPDNPVYPTRTLQRTVLVTREQTEFEKKLGALAALLPPGQRGAMDDPDGDGVPNLLELFTGRSVSASGLEPPLMQLLVAPTPDSGEGSPAGAPIGIFLVVPDDVSFSSDSQPSVDWAGYRITVQGGFALADFSAPVLEVTPPSGQSAPAGYRVRAFEINAADAPRGFLRLAVDVVE